MAEEDEAFNSVARYCSIAERCRFDVENKLKKWSLESHVIEHILRHLETEKYIDEERYCHAFVHDKLRFSKWGKLKIIQALNLRKIDKENIRNSIDNISEEEYVAVLQQLLESKRKQVRAKDTYDLKAKLIRFAAGRGFEIAFIIRCLNEQKTEE